LPTISELKKLPIRMKNPPRAVGTTTRSSSHRWDGPRFSRVRQQGDENPGRPFLARQFALPPHHDVERVRQVVWWIVKDNVSQACPDECADHPVHQKPVQRARIPPFVLVDLRLDPVADEKCSGEAEAVLANRHGLKRP
jgi:hypothetical protein